MAIIESNEYDLVQLWGLITELGEQLNQNRSMSVSLHALAGSVKSHAVHSQTGFVLRSFNMDKSKEEYDGELERMNNSMAAENQSLQHDNKQLNALIKEYEQTLETLMSTFRIRAQGVQERELSLIREYETKLLEREEDNATQELLASTAVSQALVRISYLLRQLLRAECGEEPEDPATLGGREDKDEWRSADYALERETELSRLEKENEELRRMMGLIPSQMRRDSSGSGSGGMGRAMFEVHGQGHRRLLSGLGRPSEYVNSKRTRSPG